MINEFYQLELSSPPPGKLLQRVWVGKFCLFTEKIVRHLSFLPMMISPTFQEEEKLSVTPSPMTMTKEKEGKQFVWHL